MPILKRLAVHRRAILWGAVMVAGIAMVVMGTGSVRSLQQLIDGSFSPPEGRHWVLRWIDAYGLPLVFGAMVVGAAGVPLPSNLLLLTLGSGIVEGQQSGLVVFLVALLGLVVGDHLGYLIGWWGGRWLVRRVAHWVGSDEQLPRAGKAIERHGGMAVFLTRWLISPLGSPMNWVCGSVGFPVRRFFVADTLGEILYVGIYLLLGIAFSEQIEGVAQLMGTAGLLVMGLLLVVVSAWRLFRGRAGPT